MERIEPMDILHVPTKKDAIVAKIGKWIRTSRDDNKKKICTVIFKKGVPKNILELFENNSDAFTVITDYTISKHYEIEK